MRWELIKSTAAHEIYHLYNDEKKLLSLELNLFSNAARVDGNNEKRVYLVRKEGLRRNKTVIRNEYGVKIAELNPDHPFPESLMEWCGENLSGISNKEKEPVTV